MSYSSSPTSSNGSYYDSNSRPSSASPTFNQDPMVFKMRYDAGRGFDPDDDFEFCPQLTRYPQTPERPISTAVFPAAIPLNLTAAAAAVSPVTRPTQARRALDIINPATGLRVSSPKSRS